MPELQEIQRQIHAEISKLQENLVALNSISIELEQAKKLVKEHITKIDKYIRSIQTHSTKLQDLFSMYADEIKEHTIKEINRANSSLEAVSNEILRTVNSLKNEITNLLLTNEELVIEATRLFKQIDEIKLPKRFDDIDINIFKVKENIAKFESNVEADFKSIKSEINIIHNSSLELKKQNKITFYFSIVISVIVIITLIVLIMK